MDFQKGCLFLLCGLGGLALLLDGRLGGKAGAGADGYEEWSVGGAAESSANDLLHVGDIGLHLGLEYPWDTFPYAGRPCTTSV